MTREQLDVDWRTTNAFDQLFDRNYKDHLSDWGEVQNQVSALQAVPIDHLSAHQRLGFRRMLGEALARGLQGDFDHAKGMLQYATQFAQARNEEASRAWVLEASTLACGLVLAVASLYSWLSSYSDPWFKLVVSGAAGGLGALLSVYQRVTKVPLDPAAGCKLHYYEGVARIITGVVAGWVCQIAVHVGLILSLTANEGLSAAFLIGFVAGWSERLLPTLVSQVEGKATATAPTTAKSPKPERVGVGLPRS